MNKITSNTAKLNALRLIEKSINAHFPSAVQHESDALHLGKFRFVDNCVNYVFHECICSQLTIYYYPYIRSVPMYVMSS